MISLRCILESDGLPVIIACSQNNTNKISAHSSAQKKQDLSINLFDKSGKSLEL